MDYIQWLEKAKKIIETDIEYYKVFELKSLFPLHEWEKLKNGEKRTFGRLFSTEVREGRIQTVIRVGEGKSKHNLYKKIYPNRD